MDLDAGKATGRRIQCLRCRKRKRPQKLSFNHIFRSSALFLLFLDPLCPCRHPPSFLPRDKVVQSPSSVGGTFARHTIELFQWTSDRLAGNLMRVRFSPRIPLPMRPRIYYWPCSQCRFTSQRHNFSSTRRRFSARGHVNCSTSIFTSRETRVSDVSPESAAHSPITRSSLNVHLLEFTFQDVPRDEDLYTLVKYAAIVGSDVSLGKRNELSAACILRKSRIVGLSSFRLQRG